jgi:hypothetical protein
MYLVVSEMNYVDREIRPSAYAFTLYKLWKQLTVINLWQKVWKYNFKFTYEEKNLDLLVERRLD